MDMNTGGLLAGHPPYAGHRKLSRDAAQLAVDLLPLADLASLLLGGYLATLAYSLLGHQGTVAELWQECRDRIIVIALLGPLVLYDRQLRYSACGITLGALLRRVSLGFVKLAGVALALGFASRSIDTLPRSLAAIWLGAAFLLALGSRIALVKHLRLLERRGILSETVAVVGAGPVADRLIRHLLQTRAESIEIVGIFDDRTRGGDAEATRSAAGTFQPTGTVSDLVELGKARKIDWVLLTIPCSAERRLMSIVHSLKTLAVSVGLCPESVGLMLPFRMINYVGDGLPVTMLADRPIRHWNAVLKSAEDLVLGGLITLLLLPVMAVIAVAIRLDSPGPILFRQRRHSANNDVFDVFKFRTMRWAPEASTGALRQTGVNDDRITPLGRFLRKTSLDELPQLFNVLRGEMSLVGPRPHAVNMRTEERLGHEIIDAYPHRHRVKPGMTGWAQVNGSRGATETVEQLRRRVELDIHYVENWSLAFDLKILLMTFWVVARGTNAR
ncbi:MAG: exopolysaccharide biosynthesis polyprenyl glycosylphosphotransferase [Nevskia sp.]|nr:exopolysaccharide biosynthesis polyprenyl glycosylphosphotransferase [Nevskia sp.]